MINLTPFVGELPPYIPKAWEIFVCFWSGSWKVWIQNVLQSWPPDKALGHPADPSVEGRWRGSLTCTTHHAMTHRWEPAQAGFVTIMGTVSVYVYCMCAHVLVCMHVLWGCLWARKYMCGETAVLTFSGKGVGGGEALWQVCDACSCDGSSDQRAVGCQRLITQTGRVYHDPCHWA